MPEAVIKSGGVWIHEPDRDTVLLSGEEGFCQTEFAASDLEASVSAAGISLLYDGESQIRTLNGMNIFVYDHFTERFVTAVGFDAENGYSCVR